MQRSTLVVSSDGMRGRIADSAQPTQTGDQQVIVEFEDGQQVVVPINVLVLQDDGSYLLPMRASELNAQTATGVAQGERVVVPVVQEEVSVDKRRVITGGVRVSKVVREHEEVIDEPLTQEEVEVERVPINQVVNGEMRVRQEGDTMIIPILEEVLVVSKQLILKEEVRITKRRTTVSEPQRVTVRSEEVVVDRIDPQASAVDTTTDRV